MIILALLGLLLHALVAPLSFGIQFIVLVWLWVMLLRLTWALSYVQAANVKPTAVSSFDTSIVIA